MPGRYPRSVSRANTGRIRAYFLAFASARIVSGEGMTGESAAIT